MKHRFYTKNKKEQNRIFIAIGLCAFAIWLVFVLISLFTGFYIISLWALIIILTIVAPFYDMPALKKKGKMVYYSSLFITEKPKNGVIQMHGGTLFDYYFVLDQEWNGKQRTNFIIQQYLQGLLNLLDKYENEPDFKLIGTSYIINDRTAQKLGFRLVPTNMLQKLILILNYFNILISNSLARNKLTFPNLNKTITIESTIGNLSKRKGYIEKLNAALKSTLTIKE